MPLNEGIVLPGVTRNSLLELARGWNEFKVVEKVITMKDIVTALNENRVRQKGITVLDFFLSIFASFNYDFI